jgi:hypothetical protein
MMGNNNHRSINRPLLFNTKADLHQWVYPNNSQAISASIPINIPNNNSNQLRFTSLFDRYNKPNLLLKECDVKDIRRVNKNIIMH